MQWYYAINGQQQGPVEQDALFALARTGALKPDDLVWNSTMGSQWAKASTVPGLFDAASAAGIPSSPALEWTAEAVYKSQTHNRDLMANARVALDGQWGLGVGGVALYFALVMVMSLVPYLGPLVRFVISGPLMLGWYLFFLTLSRRQPATVGMIFDGFKQFGTAFLACLLMGLLILAWALPGIVAIGIALAVGAKQMFGGGHPSPGLISLFVLCCVGALVPMMIAQYRYSMTYFIINDTPGIGSWEAIQRSTQMMKGNKWKLFCLQWRFFGWSLLCIFTLFIGLLWLVPYMMTSMGGFYDDVRKGQTSG